jgi:hypothetical protein
MNDPLHRHTKQEDAEALALALITCCAFSNSALTEDGICAGENEFYYRVAEHYCEIDEPKPIDLITTARVLETLAQQFRTFAENLENEDDDDERMQAREDESRKT